MAPYKNAWQKLATVESAESRKWRENAKREEEEAREWRERNSPNRKGSAMGWEVQERVGDALMEETKQKMLLSGCINMDEYSRKAVAHGAPALCGFVVSDFDVWGSRLRPSPAGLPAAQ